MERSLAMPVRRIAAVGAMAFAVTLLASAGESHASTSDHGALHAKLARGGGKPGALAGVARVKEKIVVASIGIAAENLGLVLDHTQANGNVGFLNTGTNDVGVLNSGNGDIGILNRGTNDVGILNG